MHPGEISPEVRHFPLFFRAKESRIFEYFVFFSITGNWYYIIQIASAPWQCRAPVDQPPEPSGIREAGNEQVGQGNVQAIQFLFNCQYQWITGSSADHPDRDSYDPDLMTRVIRVYPVRMIRITVSQPGSAPGDPRIDSWTALVVQVELGGCWVSGMMGSHEQWIRSMIKLEFVDWMFGE